MAGFGMPWHTGYGAVAHGFPRGHEQLCSDQLYLHAWWALHWIGQYFVVPLGLPYCAEFLYASASICKFWTEFEFIGRARGHRWRNSQCGALSSLE